MNKWKLIAPLGALAAAGAAALLVIRKKNTPAEGKAETKAAPAGKKNAPAEKQMKTGEYSFVSGFKDARTVTASLDFDALRFSFDVIGEDFLAYSSDSHVAVITGEDFSMQMEYASYYKGEDLAVITEAAEKKYGGVAPVSFNGVEGFRYREGDSICFCLGVDEYSYLLCTLFRAQASKLTLEEIAGGDDIEELLGTLKIAGKD